MAWTGRLLRGATLAGAALLLSSTVASAQYFNFRTTFTPNPVPASAGGRLNITNGANTSVFAGLLGSDIVLTNITTTSTANDLTPESINSNYDIFVELQPATSAGVGLAPYQGSHFFGTLSGFISANSSNVANSNLVQSHLYNFGALGTYDVFRNAYVPPGAPGTGVQGSIGAHVNGPLAVPEPGTLSLLFGSGVGGSLLFLRRLRRR